MNIGKNIAFGISYYTIIGLGIGLGSFLGIMLSEDEDEFETFFLALFSIIIFFGSGPILGAIIGVFQGLASREKPAHAAGAGFITGPIGYVIAAFIIFMLMAMAISLKYPDEEGQPSGDDEDEVRDSGPFFRMVMQIIVPISICNGLGAFITAKALSESKSLDLLTSDSKNLVPVGTPQMVSQPVPYQYQQYPQQPLQQQPPMMNCPHCGNATNAQGQNCAYCGKQIR